jgi:probable phosphoglycerate mutase
VTAGRDDPGRARIVAVRHGETEWATLGRHTGRTDIPLTEQGRRQAELAGAKLAGGTYARVLVSPLGRAMETCRLAGFGERAEPDDDLMEWNYGAYEGLRTPEIRVERPGWSIWTDGVPEGESPAEVGARADRVITDVLDGPAGDTLVFSHGHLLRVLAARWLGLGAEWGRALLLTPASICILGWERDIPVLVRWNDPPE